MQVTATIGFHHGYFPHRTRQRIDSNAAKLSCPNGPGFGFEEGPWTSATGALALLTGPAVGPEWQLGHSGHDGVAR